MITKNCFNKTSKDCVLVKYLAKFLKKLIKKHEQKF